MATIEQLMQQLQRVDLDSLRGDEPARVQLLIEAQKLINRIQRPHEVVETFTFTYPFAMLALRVAQESSVLEQLSDEPQTSHQLAEKSAVDNTLLHRMLRMLGTVGIVKALEDDHFAANAISKALSDGKGVINGLFHFWDIGIEQLLKLPSYFSSEHYRNPIDVRDTPFGRIMNTTGLWPYFEEHPEVQARFDTYLASIRKGQPSWLMRYPLQNMLSGYDPSTALCVDVGGGKGWDMTCLSQALPPEYSRSRIILQDRPSVINAASASGLPANVEVMAHDFFEPQPIRSARAYFLHSVCHDWPDREAVAILEQVRSAMRSGYSKLLLFETVMPSDPGKITPRMAAMDLNMMCHFSACERTESDWKRLLDAAGLKWISYHPGAHQGVIEAALK